jgi:hypothetical protein
MIEFLSPLRFAFKGWFLPLTLGVSLFYILLPAIFMNHTLISLILWGTDPISFKISFLMTLFLGTLTILPPIEVFFTLLTAILLGINISLLVQTIKILSTQKKVTVTVGGASLLALAGAGCASCGISILSILGISTTLLPIHGTGFLITSSFLLLLSLFVILKNKKIVCQLV